MTTARSLIVNSEEAGFYHCVTRCVRRAFLCGLDHVTGRDCSHRKRWIEERLVELANTFSLSVYAYAVMCNHAHVVLYVDPGVARAWTDADVVDRWIRLFPVRRKGQVDAEGTAIRRQSLLGDPKRIATYRERLASLSWFMRCLNEPLARLANREDGVTGRFWQGRYSCQALLDETAVLACMSYVELNPVRAGLATDLPSTEHTSVSARIVAASQVGAAPLTPVAGCARNPELSLTLHDYLELVDWTGRRVQEGKNGVIAPHAPPVLSRLGVGVAQWEREAHGACRKFRAIGSAASLIRKALAIGQRWLKGYRLART